MSETISSLPLGTVLLDREKMLEKLDISDSTLRRRVETGVLPPPIEVGGPYCLRWIEGEVDAAIAVMPRAKFKPAPAGEAAVIHGDEAGNSVPEDTGGALQGAAAAAAPPLHVKSAP